MRLLFSWAMTLLLGAVAGAAQAGEAASVDEIARLVAGLANEGSALAPLERRPRWLAYAQAIDGHWTKLETRQLEPMRTWGRQQLGADPEGEVFYPFSGPDLVNPMAILPDRRSYVLLSLEPVGMLPDLASFDEPSFDAFFAGMESSLSSALKWDFFQTKQLRRDLSVPGLEGVLPLLLFFAARDGYEVLTVHHLLFRADGTLDESEANPGQAPAGEGVPGVRIGLRRRGSEIVQHAHYFSVDLGSHSLDTRKAFFSFLAQRGPFTTYLKAASYLMFKPKYAAIQRFLLDHSRRILQDDSGVPFTELERSGWKLQLFGSYERPIRLFEHRFQEELAEAYRARPGIPPLPFAVGYKIRPRESTLMLATRPDGRVPQDASTP